MQESRQSQNGTEILRTWIEDNNDIRSGDTPAEIQDMRWESSRRRTRVDRGTEEAISEAERCRLGGGRSGGNGNVGTDVD